MLRVNIADVVILHPALKQSFGLICRVGFDVFGYDGPSSTLHTLSIFLSTDSLKLSKQTQEMGTQDGALPLIGDSVLKKKIIMYHVMSYQPLQHEVPQSTIKHLWPLHRKTYSFTYCL